VEAKKEEDEEEKKVFILSTLPCCDQNISQIILLSVARRDLSTPRIARLKAGRE